uniref:Uncharacterized protein n=1 Tax=Oncorhynchus tshawytscha TaxID=74940 RepID=A0AAZ3SA70_ONCTS
MTEGKEISYSIAMAANIPPPNPMVLTGDWNTNWDNFRDEFEDYALATGLHEKPNEVQAATLRSLMGSECRHIYRHNLTLTARLQCDAKAILDALENYFKPARNVIYERFVFGSCKQEEGGAQVNERNPGGETPLLALCKALRREPTGPGTLKLLRYLLDNQADPNAQDRSGRTALMYSCMERAGAQLASTLLSAGSDPSMADYSGASAMVYTINAQHQPTLQDNDPTHLQAV